MLVVAMVIFGMIAVIGSAAAATTEAAIGLTAAEIIGVALFFGAVTTGLVAYIRWSAKKSPDRIVRRSIKALNAAVLVGMVAVNAKHTRMIHTTGVATSPEMISRTYGTYLDTR